MRKGCIKANSSKVPGKVSNGIVRANPNSSGTGKPGKGMLPRRGGK